MKIPNRKVIISLAAYVSCMTSSYAVDETFDNLTVDFTTTLEGPVQIDDTANPSTAGQWNLTLENGLFIWGDPANSNSLNLDFNQGDTLFFWYPDKSALRFGESGSNSYDETNLGVFSTSWGRDNLAYGELSTAWGEYNTAGSTYSTAWGAFNDASAYYGSTAWGEFNTASGYVSTAFGAYVTAGGWYSTAWGHSNNASGSHSTSWGQLTLASGRLSTSWGFDTQSEGYLVTSFGRYNIGGYDMANNGTFSWVDADPLVEIGIGSSASTRANALTMLKDGRMALGYHGTMTGLQSNPETLQVQGSVLLGDDGDPATLGAIRYGNNGFEGYDGSWKSLTAYGDGSAPTLLQSPDGLADVSVQSGGNVAIGTTTNLVELKVNGSADFTGEVTISSVPAKGGISMGAFQ